MKFAVLDLETTGDQKDRDEIIQVGLVLLHDFQIVKRYSSFVKPSVSIPAPITQLTGITDEMTAEAPSIDDVVHELIPLLEDAVLVAHHAAFDIGFLQEALTDAGYAPFDGRILDTLDWLKILYPTLTSYQLSFVSDALGVPHEHPHRADSDAEATAMIWIKCLQKLLSLPLTTLQRLGYLFSHPDAAAIDAAWLLEEAAAWKAEQLDTSFPGQEYRNFVLAAEEWTVDEELERERLDSDFASFYEEIKGRMREAIPDYEERAPQEQMMQEVSAALEQGRHLVIEAGTGTGKSLGYLIPAIHHALRTDEKVVISTHTINLQEQLSNKELPLLHELSPVPFRSAVLKGRNRYLCLRKFEGKINQDLLNGREERIIAAQLVVWLTETQHGDEEELNTGPKGVEFWREVASDADSCLNRACPWFRRCFYHRARNEANKADLIITNHSLLLTDVKAEHRILPAYGQLIVDEAHHFEETASQHLGIEISYYSMASALAALYKDSRTGQLPILRSLLEKHPNPKTEHWPAKIEQLFPEIIKVKEIWDELFNALFDLLIARHATSAEGPVTVRLKPSQLPDGWDALMAMEDNGYVSLTSVLKTIDQLLAEGKEDAGDYGLESLFTDLAGTLKELYRSRDALRLILKADEANLVYWAEGNPNYRGKSLRLHAAPIDVSQHMREYFWENKDAVVMTSATLTVDKSFQYFKTQLGLTDEDEQQDRLHTVQLPSPFQYRKQALVLIPRDFPVIKGAHADQEFLDRLASSLADAALVTKGRMLVLFTSYKMLKQIHEMLRAVLEPHGISVFGQGVDSGNRSKLTRWFIQSKAAVLLGTSSFWEGVDIPGDSLTCLAIVRLPFQPPNHPLVEAKSEYLRERNENPFMKLSVPQAVIRFKQGFGRLVRTAHDKGIVLIFDTRVIETRYGKHFLYSLPGPKIEHLPSAIMPDRIKEWLSGSGVEQRGNGI